jgi:membrane fusion protein (multidrug efflux system)
MDGDGALSRGWRRHEGDIGYSAHIGDVETLATAPVRARADAPAKPGRKAREHDDENEKKNAKPDDDKSDDKKSDGDEGGEHKPPMPTWKKRLYWGIGVVALLLLITAAVIYWLYSRQFETTDDAFIDGHVSQLSSQVAGRVTRLAVDDNQDVRAGQTLIEIDPRDFDIRLRQAQAQRSQAAAQLEQARAQLVLQQAQLDQAEANARVTEADLTQAQADLARFRAVDQRAVTRQQIDSVAATAKSTQAKLDASRQQVAGARAQITAQAAQVDAAIANLAVSDVAIDNARLQLSYTRPIAPIDGQVTRRTVEVGNYVNPGQALLAVVSPQMWVTANFKETQLSQMRAGQHVRVRVDGCPDLDLDAHVDSFQAGSGSVFSSLPAENATGNYVKVVQRLPVKVVFDGQVPAACRIAPGMSVAPRVTVR